MSKFLFNTDFDGNQLVNITLEKLSADPASGSSWEGRVIYNDTEDAIKFYNGAEWISLGSGLIKNIVNGTNGAITVSIVDGTATLSVNVDDTTIERPSDVLQVKNAGITAAKLANNAVTTVKITDKNVTFAKIQDIPTMTVIGRVAAGSGVPSAVSIITDVDLSGADNTKLATSGAIKTYVDNRIAAIGTLQGSFNANTETQFPGGAGVVKGSYWYVTVAGTVQSETFNVGDVIIAAKDNPSLTDPTDWIFLESNRDQATTSILGFVMLATNAEVQAGSNNTKAVTPASLASLTATETRRGLVERATEVEALALTDSERYITPATLGAVLEASFSSAKYVAAIGDGVLTSIPVTHSLNSTDVSVNLFEVSSGMEVHTRIVRTNANTVTLSFTNAPTSGQYRVIIRK